MKLLKCPSCGVVVKAIHYAAEGTERLRCYDCSTPGKPVYIEVIETKDKVSSKAL